MPAIDAPTVKRRPIAGALFGLLFGVGFALLLAGQAVIALGTLPVVVIPLVCLILGIVWGSLGPPRGPSAPTGTGAASDDEAALGDPGMPSGL